MVSEFQQRVYDTISKIPRGKVATYKDVARAIDCSSCQAIGQALKRNPNAPLVPCHRVVGSDLSLTGYLGSKEVELKRKLLEAEGVVFINDTVSTECRFESIYVDGCVYSP